jgi:hypothetical protein
MTNGDFEKADGSAQTIPVRYSNDDSVDSAGESGGDMGLEGMQYRTAVAVDASGYVNVVYTKNTGNARLVSFTGTGTDDLALSGVYIGGYGSAPRYEVEITSASNPDLFKWRVNGGAYTSGVAITGADQALSNGVTISFTATTGHTLADKWVITPATGHSQVFRRYHNGSTWSDAQQLTNTSDMDLLPDHRPSLLIDGSTAYVMYESMSDGVGVNVLRTKDWTTFSKYAIRNDDIGLYSPGYGIFSIDQKAWKDAKDVYFLWQYNWDANTSTYTRSPLYMTKWIPSSGAGIRQKHSYGMYNYDDLVLGSVAGYVNPHGTIKYEYQNIYHLKTTDDIHTYIQKAANGEVIYLAAGTYTIKRGIDGGSKQISLIGQGGYSQGCKTTIATSAASINAIYWANTSNVRLENFCLSTTGATTKGILIERTTSGTNTGFYMRDIGITMSSTGTQTAMQINETSGYLDHVVASVTSSNSSARGLYYYNTSDANAATTLTCLDCQITTAGAATNSKPFEGAESTASQDATLYLRNCVGVATESGTTTSSAVNATGGANGIVYIDGGWFSATDADITQATSGVLNVRGAHLVNGTTSGTITYVGHPMSIAFTKSSAANTACNTTCTVGSCKFGQDTATFANVDCADATADVCFCS